MYCGRPLLHRPARTNYTLRCATPYSTVLQRCTTMHHTTQPNRNHTRDATPHHPPTHTPVGTRGNAKPPACSTLQQPCINLAARSVHRGASQVPSCLDSSPVSPTPCRAAPAYGMARSRPCWCPAADPARHASWVPVDTVWSRHDEPLDTGHPPGSSWVSPTISRPVGASRYIGPGGYVPCWLFFTAAICYLLAASAAATAAGAAAHWYGPGWLAGWAGLGCH